MLDAETGEVVNLALTHEGDHVREFYSQLEVIRTCLVSSLTRLIRAGRGVTFDKEAPCKPWWNVVVDWMYIRPPSWPAC
jgi:hypothetical protein